jgi:short chain dehydrogenase
MAGLEGKVALVTGASRGIGRAIALRLGREAASVVVNYSGNSQAAQDTVTAVEQAGGKAVAVQADVGNFAEVVRLFDETIGHGAEHPGEWRPDLRSLRFMRKLVPLLFLAVSSTSVAADYPAPTQANHLLRDLRFASGETLPELRIHYRTLGTPRRGEDGKVNNAVLILHGTTGSGANFFRPEFAGELFGESQPLDASRFFLILPDGIGQGGSSKPSDGLHARFPKYGDRDMIAAQHRLLTEPPTDE